MSPVVNAWRTAGSRPVFSTVRLTVQNGRPEIVPFEKKGFIEALYLQSNFNGLLSIAYELGSIPDQVLDRMAGRESVTRLYEHAVVAGMQSLSSLIFMKVDRPIEISFSAKEPEATVDVSFRFRETIL